jgi:hypothetical protein
MPKLTNEIINAAILGFEEQKSRIDAQIAELRAMLPAAPTAGAGPGHKPRRKMSTAGRKAIAEAQRKRWASKKSPEEKSPASKPKRKMSAAGKANIVAALKKRWAAKKAAAKSEAKK